LTLVASLLWMALAQALLLLVVLRVLPHTARRQFLFGVYLGVGRERLRATPMIFGIWNAGVAVLAVLILAACAGLWSAGWKVASFSLPPVAVIFCGVALYLHCHGRARHYGVRTPRIAVMPVVEIPLVRELVPLVLQVVPWIVVLVVMVWTFLNWKNIPDRVPVAWEAGQPVAWGARSAARVFVGPMLAFASLLLPLHAASYMLSRTKAPLQDPGPLSVRKRRRLYSRAFAWYLWGLTMLMTLVVVYVQWDAVRSMTGAGHLGRGPAVAALAVTLAALLGAVLLAVRVAHGTGREEEEAEEMRDFLHNSRWVAGLFYFNPEDPSFFIVQRFGLGFTVNLGNRRALIIAIGLLILGLLLALLPLIIFLLHS